MTDRLIVRQGYKYANFFNSFFLNSIGIWIVDTYYLS